MPSLLIFSSYIIEHISLLYILFKLNIPFPLIYRRAFKRHKSTALLLSFNLLLRFPTRKRRCASELWRDMPPAAVNITSITYSRVELMESVDTVYKRGSSLLARTVRGIVVGISTYRTTSFSRANSGYNDIDIVLISISISIRRSCAFKAGMAGFEYGLRTTPLSITTEIVLFSFQHNQATPPGI